jgi:hypothetical protein
MQVHARTGQRGRARVAIRACSQKDEQDGKEFPFPADKCSDCLDQRRCPSTLLLGLARRMCGLRHLLHKVFNVHKNNETNHYAELSELSEPVRAQKDCSCFGSLAKSLFWSKLLLYMPLRAKPLPNSQLRLLDHNPRYQWVWAELRGWAGAEWRLGLHGDGAGMGAFGVSARTGGDTAATARVGARVRVRVQAGGSDSIFTSCAPQSRWGTALGIRV